MKRDHVSFDVFDTCLVRRCGMPYKIWDLMADRLFDKDDVRGRLSFTGNRSLAEKNASVESHFPTLKDIYDEMNVAQWGFNQDVVMNLEMEIEEQELFPNSEILKVVNDYREKNYKIAFVSDMYLPTEFIKKILIKFGFCRENEDVFVSADCKATKYGGKLFDYVFEKTGTKAKQWIHYGDNERSDYRVPKSKGIKANLVSNTDFTEEEKRWLDDACFYPHKNEIELWAGLCRLTRLQNEKSYAATMAIDFIASVYVPYVVYVLRAAKEKGIKTLYFLARDAHIFLEIAKTLKKESEGIECRYLKVSRRVLYESAFYNVDKYELSLVIDNAHDQTVEDCLNHMNLEWEKLSNKTKSEFPRTKRLNSKKRLQLFKECLRYNDAELIKKHSSEKRTLLIKYLEQEHFFQQRSALVDLGWVGSCRCVINYILHKEGYKTVSSFYWGYNSNLLYGNSFDELFVYNGQEDIVKKYSCAHLFFEKYASINANGTTRSYKRENSVVLPVEGDFDESILEQMTINEFMVKECVKNLPSEWNCANFDVFLCCGVKQMKNIFKQPTKKHREFFKYIKFENYSIATQMVRKLSLKDFFALLVWGVPASMIWTEAAIKVTFGPFAGMFTKLYKYTSKTAFANRLRLWLDGRM